MRPASKVGWPALPSHWLLSPSWVPHCPRENTRSASPVNCTCSWNCYRQVQGSLSSSGSIAGCLALRTFRSDFWTKLDQMWFSQLESFCCYRHHLIQSGIKKKLEERCWPMRNIRKDTQSHRARRCCCSDRHRQHQKTGLPSRVPSNTNWRSQCQQRTPRSGTPFIW